MERMRLVSRAKLPARNILLCLTAAALLVLTGCATRTGSEARSGKDVFAIVGSYDCERDIKPQRNHAVYVTKDGNFYDIGCGTLREVRRNSAEADDPGRRDAVKAALDTRIARILERIDEGPVTEVEDCSTTPCTRRRVKHVVLFVHGGLRTVKASIGRTGVLQEAMLADGVNPILLNWRSGFFTTYWDHLWRVRQGTATSGRRWQLPFTLLSDVLRTIADVPTAWASEAQHSIESWRVRKKSRVEAFAELPNSGPYGASVSFTGNEDVSHLRRDLLWWATGPVKIVTTPLVHTLGKPPWDIMRTRALSIANRDARFPQLQNASIAPVTPSVCLMDPAGCRAQQTMSWLLQALQAHIDARSEDGSLPYRYEVTIIGHSMGAIVVNDALRNNPSFHARRIVHMASADSVLNTVATIVPYLANTPAREEPLLQPVAAPEQRRSGDEYLGPGAVRQPARVDRQHVHLAGHGAGAHGGTLRELRRFRAHDSADAHRPRRLQSVRQGNGQRLRHRGAAPAPVHAAASR